jgi:hypothetical protein
MNLTAQNSQLYINLKFRHITLVGKSIVPADNIIYNIKIMQYLHCATRAYEPRGGKFS